MPPNMQNEILNKASQSMKNYNYNYNYNVLCIGPSLIQKPETDIITKIYPPCFCDNMISSYLYIFYIKFTCLFLVSSLYF